MSVSQIKERLNENGFNCGNSVIESRALSIWAIQKCLGCDEETAKKFEKWHLDHLNHVLSVRFDYSNEKMLFDEIKKRDDEISVLKATIGAIKSAVIENINNSLGA